MADIVRPWLRSPAGEWIVPPTEIHEELGVVQARDGVWGIQPGNPIVKRFHVRGQEGQGWFSACSRFPPYDDYTSLGMFHHAANMPEGTGWDSFGSNGPITVEQTHLPFWVSLCNVRNIPAQPPLIEPFSYSASGSYMDLHRAGGGDYIDFNDRLLSWSAASANWHQTISYFVLDLGWCLAEHDATTGYTSISATFEGTFTWDFSLYPGGWTGTEHVYVSQLGGMPVYPDTPWNFAAVDANLHVGTASNPRYVEITPPGFPDVTTPWQRTYDPLTAPELTPPDPLGVVLVDETSAGVSGTGDWSFGTLELINESMPNQLVFVMYTSVVPNQVGVEDLFGIGISLDSVTVTIL